MGTIPSIHLLPDLIVGNELKSCIILLTCSFIKEKKRSILAIGQALSFRDNVIEDKYYLILQRKDIGIKRTSKYLNTYEEAVDLLFKKIKE